MNTTKLRIDEYRVYVVDMDGTLYYKGAMQIRMAFCLIWHYFRRMTRLRELLVLRSYRILRDRDEIVEKEDFENWIIHQLSETYNYSHEKIREIVEEWIQKRPLRILSSCRDQRLINFLQTQRLAQKRVYIYSDYPARKKCEAIGINADGIYYPDKKKIRTLKPSAQGLNHIIDENGLEKSEILFIGDRYEKDGACAESAGVDFLILKKNRISRKAQYRSIL